MVGRRARSVLALLALPAAAGGSLAKIHKALAAKRSELEVLVVMSTTPSRLFGPLEAAVDSIFAQTFPPDLVVLSLPRGPLLRDQAKHYPEDSELPAFLARPRRGLLVDRSCKDEGPGTGLLNGLRHARRRDALVIHLDDDQAYSRDHLAVLVYVAEDPGNRGTAVATVGLHSRPEFRPCLDQAAWTSGCVGRAYIGHTFGPLTIGWMGTVVRPWFFGPTGRLQAAEQPEWPDECRKHDDLWLGAQLARRGIRRIGINWGLPGRARELTPSRGGTYGALYPQNRWNLLRCNAALVGRWPSLWDPRPRLVALSTEPLSKAVEAAVARCVGHVDQWLDAAGPRRGGGGLDAVGMQVVAATELESDDAVALVIQGEPADHRWCSKVSTVLQCAMSRPDARCATPAAAAQPEAAGPRAVAATVGAWRQAGTELQDLGACWTRPNASWARCCWPQDARWPVTRRKAAAAVAQPSPGPGGAADEGAAELLGQLADAFRPERQLRAAPPGCPLAASRCCDVHPRLSRRWLPFTGKWRVLYDDGSRGHWEISEEGGVQTLPDRGAASSEERQLEATAAEGSARLVARDGRALGEELEVWHFVHGGIRSTTVLPNGHLRVGVASPVDDCFGCA